MKWLLERAIPCTKIFEIATSFEEFENWLNNEHNKTIDEKFFLGYRFFLDCAFSSIFDSIANSNDIGIKSDLLLNCALSQIFYIEKLPITCDKTILLKNIYFYYKSIEKSSSYEGLKKNLNLFSKNVLSVINSIYDNEFSLNKSHNLSKDLTTGLIIIEALYFLFNQVENNGPVAYKGWLLELRPSKEKLDTCLYGYAFTIQFVWYKVLGEEKYRKLYIQNIHKSTSWKEYNYNKNEQKSHNELGSFFIDWDRTFDLEKQTCFDSYFYWLRNELIQPLEDKYVFFLKHNSDLFKIKKNIGAKKYFKRLLDKSHIKQSTLTLEEELDMMLYWHPVEVANADITSMHSGVPALITLMSGTANLLHKHGEFDKVYICKFIHPRNEEKGSDYSYGILLDAKASADHYCSGWMLYYDCCGDYSGFSGHEYKKVEELIKVFQKEKIIHLAIKSISKKEFKNYIGKYLPSKERLSNIKATNDLAKSLDKITLTREFNDFISKAKALVLELISYYATTKSKEYGHFNIKEWSQGTKHGEIDVLLENEQKAILIECKTNINNGCLQEYIDNARLNLQDKCPNKIINIEFWCWVEPSKQSIAKIHKEGCEYKSLLKDDKLSFRNHLRLSRISQILNFNKTNEDYFEKNISE